MKPNAQTCSTAADQIPDMTTTPVNAIWRSDGPFILNGQGKRVAMMQGEPAEYEWAQRRLIAAVNALEDTPTQYIEELLEKCGGNIILTMIEREKSLSATLKGLEERIAVHRREIAQLQEVMDACSAFDAERTRLHNTPGSVEYEGLMRALGLRP